MIGAIIRTALAGDAALTALVGTRIYPEVAPDEAGLPFVVYTIRGGEGVEGNAPLWSVTVTANAYGESDGQAEAVGQAVRAVLDGFDGGDAVYLVRALWMTDYSEQFDFELAEWGRMLTFGGFAVRRNGGG